MRKTINGYTIVELLIVIAIIGIVATIVIVSFPSVQMKARDAQRSSRITVIAEALEKYYDKNGEYPNCATMTAQPASVVTTNTLKGTDPNVLTAPNASGGTNSVDCNTPASSDAFGYLGGGGHYTLQHREESSGNIISLASRHSEAPSRVSGYVLNDLDGDGVNDGVELPLSGWTVTIFKASTGAFRSTTTNASGYYEFTLTPAEAGTWAIYETRPNNWWRQTFPAPPGSPITVVVASGNNYDNNNFLNYKQAYIWGYKFEDKNKDACWNSGEPALSNWVIVATRDDNGNSMIDPSETTTKSATTAGSGYAMYFAYNETGSWIVTEVQQPLLYQQSYPMSGKYILTITSGASYGGKDFGNYLR